MTLQFFLQKDCLVFYSHVENTYIVHIIPEEGRFEPVYHFIHMLSFCQVILSLCHIMLFICHHAISCHPCVIMTYLSICHHDILSCPCITMTYVVHVSYHAVCVTISCCPCVSMTCIVHMSP